VIEKCRFRLRGDIGFGVRQQPKDDRRCEFGRENPEKSTERTPGPRIQRLGQIYSEGVQTFETSCDKSPLSLFANEYPPGNHDLANGGIDGIAIA
jgi:hypothetical protein